MVNAVMKDIKEARAVLDAICDRSSVRAFTDRAVDPSLLKDIFKVARRAPSGANLQPGRFLVLRGSALSNLKEVLIKAYRSGCAVEEGYTYFPKPLSDTLKKRQREVGAQLYSSLGIHLRDIEKRRRQFERNYRFFDAPVGIIVTIDREMGAGCYMDLGMTLQSFFLASHAMGFATCGIGAIAALASVVHQHCALPEQELVVCGIAFGYGDSQAEINQFRTPRCQLEEYTTWQGFSED